MHPFLQARAEFPALQHKVEGNSPVFFDAPGGTQVPQRVAEAMVQYLTRYNSNLMNSPFFAVQHTHHIVAQARQNAASLFHAPTPETIIFGGTMSSLTAHISRSIAKGWQAGDEIILSALDHFANVSFWQQAAEDHGVIVRLARVNPADGTLDHDHLESLINHRTKLIAFTLASNVTGSYTDAPRIIQAAKQAGALTYLDAVHAAPHHLLDVQALNCDFMACSAYKFCGPHLGLLYGNPEHLAKLTPYKVAPAPDHAPDCWEMGTKSFEALAAFNAQIDYFCQFYPGEDKRASLANYYENLTAYERQLSEYFLDHAAQLPTMRIYGITDRARLHQRTPTFAFNLRGHSPQAVSDHLARHQIAAGAGHFYAQGVVDALGLTDSGGFVRVGLVHYNNMEEIDRFFECLKELD